MNFINCVVSVYRMTGTHDNKTYVLAYTDKDVLLVPATTDIIALYGDLPLGSTYSFLFLRDVPEIKPEDKLTITESYDEAYSIGDEFIVSGNSKSVRYMNSQIIEGICVKKS